MSKNSQGTEYEDAEDSEKKDEYPPVYTQNEEELQQDLVGELHNEMDLSKSSEGEIDDSDA